MNTNINSDLVKILNDCASSCNYCAAACLSEKDVTMLAACIKLDIDCAEICSLAANLLSRNSPHGKHLLQECAEVCGKCATECERHAPHMDHCRECAEACRKCEAACKA